MHPHLTGDIETGFAPTESVKNQNLTNQRGGDFLLAEFSKVLHFLYLSVYFLDREVLGSGGKGRMGPPLPPGEGCVSGRLFSHLGQLIPGLGQVCGWAPCVGGAGGRGGGAGPAHVLE